MGQEPAVRARSAHDALAYLEKVDPESLPRMWSHLPQEVVRVIRETPKTGWIPLQQDRVLARSWEELFGPERGLELIKGAVRQIFDSPLIAPLLRPSLRLLGANPGTVVKVLPRAFPLTYRNLCKVVAGERGRNHAKVHFTDMHPLFIEAVDDYELVFRAVFAAFYDVTEHEGEVSWQLDRTARRGTWTLSW